MSRSSSATRRPVTPLDVPIAAPTAASSPEAPVVPLVLQTFPSDLRFTRNALQLELSIVYLRQAGSTPATMNMTTPYVKFDIRTTSPKLFVIKGGRRRAIQEQDSATVLVRIKLADVLRQVEASTASAGKQPPPAGSSDDASGGSKRITGRLLVAYEYITAEQYHEWSQGWGRLVRGEQPSAGSVDGSGGASPKTGPSMEWKGRNFDMLASGSVVVPWEIDLDATTPLLPPARGSSVGLRQRRVASLAQAASPLVLLPAAVLCTDGEAGPAQSRSNSEGDRRSAAATTRSSSSGGGGTKSILKGQPASASPAKRGQLIHHLQEEVRVLRAELAAVELASLQLLRDGHGIVAAQRAAQRAQAVGAPESLGQKVWAAVDSVEWVEVAAVGLMLCSTALLALNI